MHTGAHRVPALLRRLGWWPSPQCWLWLQALSSHFHRQARHTRPPACLALKPHLNPQQALCGAFCTDWEVVVCAGTPALHLFSESTTVWLCALTAVHPSHSFHQFLELDGVPHGTYVQALWYSDGDMRDCVLQPELSCVPDHKVCANRRILTYMLRAESHLARPAAMASKGVRGRLCSASTAVTTTSLGSRCTPLQHACHSCFRTACCNAPVQHSEPTKQTCPHSSKFRPRRKLGLCELTCKASRRAPPQRSAPCFCQPSSFPEARRLMPGAHSW